MIKYTPRLDNAIKMAAWSHEQAKQHRKGSDAPYIIHPFGVMVIAGNVTNDEDILIACLMHDILEDVDCSIYSENEMRKDFGDRVVSIVKDVTKDESISVWRDRSKAYLNHLEHQASDEAVIVSAADKIHNLLSIISDYAAIGDELWQRFSTKNSRDQLWWYESILSVIQKRHAPKELSSILQAQVELLSVKLTH